MKNLNILFVFILLLIVITIYLFSSNDIGKKKNKYDINNEIIKTYKPDLI
jgi:hypothetical protein